MNELYIVKTIHLHRNSEDWFTSSDGIFLQVLDAFEAVETNSCDLCEAGYNQYAAILQIPEGMYPIGEELGWFCWNREEGRYEPCDRPHFADGCAFSI